jgi:hypothetical protein
MKKIIFSGFCMLTSISGIITMILVAIKLSETYGTINGQSSLPTYLDLYAITPLFYLFCLLGILAFFIGLWGIFEKDTK